MLRTRRGPLSDESTKKHCEIYNEIPLDRPDLFIKIGSRYFRPKNVAQFVDGLKIDVFQKQNLLLKFHERMQKTHEKIKNPYDKPLPPPTHGTLSRTGTLSSFNISTPSLLRTSSSSSIGSIGSFFPDDFTYNPTPSEVDFFLQHFGMIDTPDTPNVPDTPNTEPLHQTENVNTASSSGTTDLQQVPEEVPEESLEDQFAKLVIDEPTQEEQIRNENMDFVKNMYVKRANKPIPATKEKKIFNAFIKTIQQQTSNVEEAKHIQNMIPASLGTMNVREETLKRIFRYADSINQTDKYNKIFNEIFKTTS